ncbi:phosphatase PAP2 family protein [Peredibacter starrii]|uniref:Phosphatase PAP2 family protein n=1 Tax=Peredibacter starrii TaxID=28202 RepID=A0AAX4HK07_9BACT|nr:phosphatase PAP2 family protein [Peredibacter starrii]WPU63526.1 phosphatase PAP2 family protein [Peredibacter starrii]
MKYALSLILGVVFTVAATAQTGNEKDLIILSPFEIDRVLGSFPAPGSVAEGEDLEILRKYQENRTKKDCQLAAQQESATLGSLFGHLLTRAEVEELSIDFLKQYGEAGGNAYLAKKLYGRPRPYDSHRDLKPCISKETSESYPSGHATVARVFARLLANKFPKRAAAFIKAGNQAALNRVIGGVHYPSDVLAGIKLGDHLADKMIRDNQRRNRRD